MKSAKTIVYVSDDEGIELEVEVKFRYVYEGSDYWNPPYMDLRLDETNVISFDGLQCDPYPSPESLDDAIIEKCWEFVENEL